MNVNGQTEWDNGETLADLTTTSVVQISGTIDRADSTIDADEVAILTQNGFYAAGQITYVQPSSGVASDFNLYVRGTLPASGDGVTDGQIAQVDLSGSEKFFIYWMHNPFTQFLFNPSIASAWAACFRGRTALGRSQWRCTQRETHRPP